MNLSSHKAANVCKQLREEGVLLSTPSQSGVYKAVMREAAKRKQELKETLKNDKWVLHFDGKRQVVVVKNNTREIKLAALTLKNGRADTIFQGLKEVLDDYELWPAIKMIITNTCSVNTGKHTGVVIQLRMNL
uniref:Uncharacterized protein n=1 Tax=Octopus bimaculoides TaxID=37653 RepID=A0A0L8HU38_OCTBM